MKFILIQRRKFDLFLLVLALVLPVAANAGVSVSVSQPSSSTANVSSTTTIKASASSDRSITGWRIYVDGRSAWSAGSTRYISATISMSSGTHKVYVKAWDSTGASGTSVRTLIASGSSSAPSSSNSGLPTPPSNAKVFYNIEDGKYEDCNTCAGHPDEAPKYASYSRSQWQSSPSLSGSSMKMWIGGSVPYSNALHWTKLGSQNWARNFMWEFWVYGKEDSYAAEALEFDVWQSIGGRKYMFASQCAYQRGTWQGWDENRLRWVDFANVPCTKFPAHKWTRVVLYVQRTSDNRLRYVTLKVGDKTHNLNMYQYSARTYWGDSTGVQFQQDLNVRAADYSVWVDKVKLTIW